MGRIGRGWQLSKESWAIVKADRSLLVFPVVAGIGALIAVAAFGGAGAGLYSTSAPLAIVIGVIGLYVVIALSIFCNVALTACAARSLEGVDTQASEGWATARARSGQILASTARPAEARSWPRSCRCEPHLRRHLSARAP